MREIVLHVPDDRSAFIMELLAQLGFERTQDDADAPALVVQELVLNRRSQLKREELLNWEEIENSFTFQS